jgi:hypothetical protein
MTARPGSRAAAVGLLTEGTFAAPGILTQRRFGREGAISWVGFVVRDGSVEGWELQRSAQGRPLKLDAAAVRTFTLRGDSAEGDVRVDSDRGFPRLWIRWMAQGQLACAGFVPVREAAIVRPLPVTQFTGFAHAIQSVLPSAP